MTGNEAIVFRSWLEQDGLYGHLAPHGHAACALPTEQSVIDELNRAERTFGTDHAEGGSGWNDDDWIIGTAGNGDLYVISRSGSYDGVWEYAHETGDRMLLAPTLRDFYEFCIGIERNPDDAA